MDKKDKDQDMQNQENEEVVNHSEENLAMEEESAVTPPEPAQEEEPIVQEESLEEQLRKEEEKYLRLLAEYDNFRKRSQRERDGAWTTAKAETAAAFLPVYDNLERALKQETSDEAYAKGVEMIMEQMKAVLDNLGVEEIAALGEIFDPELHNAVMHIDDESLGDNIVVEVFQSGFKINGKVIRHAMVKVAN